MHDLGRKLLRYVSRGLGLESNRIEQSLEELHHSMLMNRYLPCPQPELVLALRSHTDLDVIPLLVNNGVPGLQVLKDGAWITVHSLPGAIVVTMGDQLEVKCTSWVLTSYVFPPQIMSNGKYKSPEHRTLANSDSTRYSIASFFEPPPAGLLIAPVPELVNAQDESHFQAVCYRDYLAIFFAKQASELLRFRRGEAVMKALLNARPANASMAKELFHPSGWTMTAFGDTWNEFEAFQHTKLNSVGSWTDLHCWN
ncbi:flavonol synthase/flavanone 3-hydroxylase [Selaginella moellendorffii]|uniref:flavonol synthase/flavanone 3-hydroxylase n=1 Tax=Selaginella moellendorffii TaxID=88036 RepID=UPI000D1C6043|nr:flavonol synthase/flavanone 3-hydroxylase [Selaginella moellendorffii]|eukprot:XP_024540224.1 flavonol synthase/flavanone 3-hydroxylase [Selaginella moellendorffii]